MRKCSALILVLLAGLICLGIGYGLGARVRAQDKFAAFQAMMGWSDAQLAEYLDVVQVQVEPAEMAEMVVWLKESMRDEALRFEEDQMVTTITCIAVLKWLEQGQEQDVKEFCIRRIVRAYNVSEQRYNPLLRDAFLQMRQSVDDLAADVPALREALAASAAGSAATTPAVGGDK